MREIQAEADILPVRCVHMEGHRRSYMYVTRVTDIITALNVTPLQGSIPRFRYPKWKTVTDRVQGAEVPDDVYIPFHTFGVGCEKEGTACLSADMRRAGGNPLQDHVIHNLRAFIGTAESMDRCSAGGPPGTAPDRALILYRQDRKRRRNCDHDSGCM